MGPALGDEKNAATVPIIGPISLKNNYEIFPI